MSLKVVGYFLDDMDPLTMTEDGWRSGRLTFHSVQAGDEPAARTDAYIEWDCITPIET